MELTDEYDRDDETLEALEDSLRERFYAKSQPMWDAIVFEVDKEVEEPSRTDEEEPSAAPVEPVVADFEQEFAS
jgi:hypothetical protein